ncbi:metallophosphoesterase family protein [Thermodesulfobacteriota bacterium]
MLIKDSMRRSLLILIAASVILTLSFSPCLGKELKAWSFGVMGDTQWTPYGFKDGKSVPGNDPEGKNPNSVSVSIITQFNKEFIEKGVKFVIQVGDITDWGTDEAIVTRAKAAAELYDAGIGFFCMRGNHETYSNLYFRDAEPNDYGIPAIQENFPQHRGIGKNVFGASNFSSPSSSEADLENMAAELDGLSYAFDYGENGSSATFLVIDPWVTQTRSNPNEKLHVIYGYSIKAQQKWISDRLNIETRGTSHAFVFSHQPLMAANHVDSPFGFLDSNLEDQNIFYSELKRNGVSYYIAGHDHIHQRNIVKSPDGNNEVEQLICISACPKFYRPRPDDFEGWHGQKYRSTTLSQEIDNIGFYIFTIDGPNVTVDYYSDRKGGFVSGNKWPDGSGSLITPEFEFIKKESWGYSLN